MPPEGGIASRPRSQGCPSASLLSGTANGVGSPGFAQSGPVFATFACGRVRLPLWALDEARAPS